MFDTAYYRETKCLKDIKWPEVPRGIRLKGAHKDKTWYTPYVIEPEQVQLARNALYEYYNDEETTDEQRAQFDLCIKDKYGTREAFDAVTWPVRRMKWGDP